MSEPRKQHYVPQTYLRRFTVPNQKLQKVFTLHKDKNKIFPTSIRDTAAERHFYTMQSTDDKYQWENTYAEEIEPILDDVLTSIIKQSSSVLLRNNSSILNDKLKLQLSISIVSQLLRGKQSRDYQKNLYAKFAPSIVQELRKLDVQLDTSKERIISDFLEGSKYFKDISFDITFRQDSIEKYVNILLRRNFLIYRITGEAEFITSDNPVMLMNSISLEVKPFSNGLSDDRTVVFFPISPKLLVAIYSSNYLFGRVSNYDGMVLFIDSLKDKAFIMNHNVKQFEQSFNQVYAKDKKDLEGFL